MFNCLEKLNPLERFVVESRCIDCKPTDVLGYEWSLYILSKDNKGNDFWVKVNNWAQNTSTGIHQGSLVINPNVLVQVCKKLQVSFGNGKSLRRKHIYAKDSRF